MRRIMFRSKTTRFLKIAALLLPLVLFVGGAGAETGARKLTLMIYMCGSNLESQYGSATADIQEMLDAGVRPGEVSVLMMTGGSDTAETAGYFDARSTGIHEIGGNRIRRVWQSDEALNMGEQATLEELLRYGLENRPAERYALILWDHGGGPLEGTCWDELHGMDRLTLREVTGALERGLKGRKLSWLGFDACLMSSLEVAGQMAPWAEYLIASQETEPAFGWNYAFLRGIEKDADGAETGRRIVDAYFEGREDSGEILTLACTDLGRVQETIEALDPVFVPVEQRLGREQFLALSGLRMSATGFGKADPGAASSGYDLVDLKDLVRRMDQTEASERLLALLEETVVYSRASEEGACGLSLYHPYANKTGFQQKWKEAYAGLPFSAGYQQYVESFGRMLTGETLFRWLDLTARAEAPDGQGSFSFEMDLSPEQAENLISAQLLILRDTMGSELDENCVIMASCPAELGEDGRLRASWDGRFLYAETGSGRLIGPVSFLQTDDGKTNTVIGYYIPEGNYRLEGQTVLFEMDAEDRTEYPEIRRVRVWDEATGSYSSRMRFSEEGYGSLQLYNYHRAVPEAGADRTLPDFQQWEAWSDSIHTSSVPLPDTWRLRAVRADTGEQCHAVFRIVDSQQNAVCSLPAEVPNPYRREAKAENTLETDGLRMALGCTVNTSPDRYGLQLEWQAENTGTEDLRIMAREIRLNGSRLTDALVSLNPRAGRTDRVTGTVDSFDLFRLDRLDSISGILEIRPVNAESTEAKEIPFLFRFRQEDLSQVQPKAELLAETERDGIRMSILGIEPDDGCGWRIRMAAENRSAQSFGGSKQVLVNGIGTELTDLEELEPGCSRIFTLPVTNLLDPGLTFALADGPEAAMVNVCLEENLLQAAGETKIREISLVSEGKGHRTFRADFPLKEPYPLGGRRWVEDTLLFPAVHAPEELPDPPEEELPVLRENSLYRVRLRRILAGDGKIALSLEAENLSEVWIRLGSGPCAVNGNPVSSGLDGFGLNLAPHTRILTPVLLSGETLERASAEETAVETLDLCFYDRVRETDPQPCLLTVQEPFRMGKTAWRNGNELSGNPVRAGETDLQREIHPQALAEEVLIPEHPEQYQRLLEIRTDPEENGGAERAVVSVVRPEEDGLLELLTTQAMAVGEDGTLTALLPGIIAGFAGEKRMDAWTFLTRTEEGLRGEILTEPSILTEDMGLFPLQEIAWEYDARSGRARVTGFSADGSLYAYQSDLVSMTVPRARVIGLPDEQGILPHLSQMTVQGGINEYVSSPGTALQGKPAQLELRPVQEELRLLVSVSFRDGSSRSLDLMPLPESRGEKP
ncbi:MAG: hypothetical protein J6J41_00330 [Clostridia bacterium]|nr:hypothetical protein [Clostridia bacterium]